MSYEKRKALDDEIKFWTVEVDDDQAEVYQLSRKLDDAKDRLDGSKAKLEELKKQRSELGD